jgi:membrane-associated protease RseP (regulator of RpoE activity)
MGVELIGPYKINDQNGMQVKSVAPNGPGDKSGIVSGDFIVEINNVKINDIDQVINQSSVPAGQSVLLKIIKANNSERIIHVTMAEKSNALETTNNEMQIEVENKSTTNNKIDNNHTSSSATNETPIKEDDKDTPNQNDENTDFDSSKGLWILLLIIISGIGIYYLKQQKTQNVLAVPKKNRNQLKTNVKTKKVATQKPRKEMSREDLLKQQQINAFKNLK